MKKMPFFLAVLICASTQLSAGKDEKALEKSEPKNSALHRRMRQLSLYYRIAKNPQMRALLKNYLARKGAQKAKDIMRTMQAFRSKL
jgi:hypothetical protein